MDLNNIRRVLEIVLRNNGNEKCVCFISFENVSFAGQLNKAKIKLARTHRGTKDYFLLIIIKQNKLDSLFLHTTKVRIVNH